MKELLLAKNAGFCFGVKRAIDEVNRILASSKEIYSIGQIIHNERVINDLQKKGLITISDDEALKLKNKNIIIRTHGIEKEKFEILKLNNSIIDLTCPYVKKIQNLTEKHSSMDEIIIVIGNKEHEEIRGIVSYAKGPIFVVNSENDIKCLKIDKNAKIFVVFQTTFNITKGQKFVEILKNMFYNIQISNTICNATELRQNETYNLSKHCDTFLVIGSSASSNTNKLYEVASKNCRNVYLVNDVKDLSSISIGELDIVGVNAGASVPEYLIREIIEYARSNF